MKHKNQTQKHRHANYYQNRICTKYTHTQNNKTKTKQKTKYKQNKKTRNGSGNGNEIQNLFNLTPQHD